MKKYNYYVLEFMINGDKNQTSSMCVLGYRKPTIEEAKEFWKKDCELYGDETLIDVYEITKEEALQPNLQRPTPELKNRNDFWQYYYKYGFEKSYKKYLSPHITIKTVIKKGLIMLLKILRLK